MSGSLLLGIDIGTYSSKGVLCTPEGEVVASHVVEHGISMPRPGWVEQDADAIWWHDTIAICRALISDEHPAEEIAGVAVSAIGPCMLPVDEKGNALRPGVLYGIDTRAHEEIDWLNDRYGKEALFDLGGMALTSQAVGPKILWLKRHEPEVYARTHKILSASSYLIHKLTGAYVIDKHTGAHANPLIDIDALAYDDRFAEPIIGLDRMPDLRWSTEIAGTVTQVAAEQTGLASGTPVTAGAVDAAAEALSVGVTEPGDLMVMYGTTLFFVLVTDRPIPDERMWATGYVLPGLYDIAGGMATSGAITRWFRDEFGAAELAAEAAGGLNAYAALAEAAERIPAGSGGLLCLPYFAGERTPIQDPEARGVFAGLTLSHTRAHLYRAILEGTAYGVRHNLDTFRAMGAAPRRLVAVGGGANNRLWLQIVSDVTGEEQVVPERTVGASYGDAMLAGLATGLVPDVATLRSQWVRVAEVLPPDMENHARYDAYYAVYRDLYEHSKSEIHQLARLSSSVAPD